MLQFTDIFPVVPGTKIPAVRWSQKWFGEIPAGQMYGVPTGPRNGVWVLDIDRKDGVDGLASLREYCADNGESVPDTYVVKTPSGGYHFYFAWDPARPVRNRMGLLPGIDVRGDKGYVRAGGAYVPWNDAHPVPAPDWLIALVTGGKSAETFESAVAVDDNHPEWSFRVSSAKRFLAECSPCLQGRGGQKQIWSIALRLSRTYELPVAKSIELLADYNARCVPPWDVSDLARTLQRAAEIGEGPTGMFAENFMAVQAKSAEASWRKKKSDKSEYACNLSQEIAGGAGKLHTYSVKDLAAIFTGPSASPDWVGVWQYDMFLRRPIAVHPPFHLDAETTGISATDIARVQVWLSCIGAKASTDAVWQAIYVASSEAKYHPVRDYLDSLETVSVEDADRYFRGIAGRLWGATERNELESGHLRRWAIAAVRRIRKPGTKVDVMLMLAGEQGYNKSRFGAHLFGEYFRDQLPNLGGRDNREASIALEGYWGIEVAEMAAFSGVPEAVKKEFITRPDDNYRPLWSRGTQRVPRECVFLGTTNEDDFLDDPTGHTRYDICEVKKEVDLSWDRSTFWSAANALEAAGETHYRPRAEVAQSGEDVGRYDANDPWMYPIAKFVRDCKGDVVTASQVLSQAIALPLDRQGKRELKRVQAVLRRLLGPSTVQWVEGRAQRVYAVTHHVAELPPQQ